MALNVLIVDDTESRRLTFAALARKAVGVAEEHFLAKTIEEAASIVEHYPIQIAIVDLLLKPNDEDRHSEDVPLASISLIEQIRDRNRDAQIIAVTKDASDSQGFFALRAGANDFVSEDWGIIQLEAYLLKWLHFARRLQQNLAIA